MAEAQAGPSGANRRSRKRRRRAKSYSVDSSSDDESSEGGVKPVQAGAAEDSSDSDDSDSDDSDSDGSASGGQLKAGKTGGSDSDSSDSSDDSDSDSSGDDSDKPKSAVPNPAAPLLEKPRQARYPTLSPSPPPHSLPPFLAKRPLPAEAESERRQKFRDVYMTKLVEAFGGDLEQMRAAALRDGAELWIELSAGGPESQFGQTATADRVSPVRRVLSSPLGLTLIIGMDVFSDPQDPNGNGKAREGEEVDEVGVIIGQT